MASYRIHELLCNDECYPTKTTGDQVSVEQKVLKIFRSMQTHPTLLESGHLLKEEHLLYLYSGLQNLSVHFELLDASRPWLCYWILHSIELLQGHISKQLASSVVKFLSLCQHKDGGFGGGPGELPHLAPTYAAILTLCTIGTNEAYEIIDRANLKLFLSQMHQPDGSFIMHKDGEVDVRGAYCAIVVANLTNILSEDLLTNTPEWISSCQTYEGGFSAVPGTEAHGGYTFCAFAALCLLKKASLCDIQSVLRWSIRRQTKLEGGFQGRTNKLVDGCYSFWVGGLFPLIHFVLKNESDDNLDTYTWHFNQESLQKYILYCCQCFSGGLIDKPGKYADYYHTCYCLSGLSVSQHSLSKTVNITEKSCNILEPIHPAFNITIKRAAEALEFFCKLPKSIIVQ